MRGAGKRGNKEREFWKKRRILTDERRNENTAKTEETIDDKDLFMEARKRM